MPSQPNILLFLTDGMQAATVDDGHFCQTPVIDAFVAHAVRFTNAHTTCPTCSPARASLMTGLLPHNHGVLEVEHGRDDDQCVLRSDRPHFAQRLSAAGYKTGYFGKWHIERSNRINQFGWQQGIVKGAEHLQGLGRGDSGPQTFELDDSLTGFIEGPSGYNRTLHWGVTDTPLDERYPGITTRNAEDFLDRSIAGDKPWCCCVSFSEPNEALVVGRETWDSYDGKQIPLPENFFASMDDRPNMYRREQQIGRNISEAHWHSARRCYYGRITELDTQLGRLLSKLRDQDQLDNTIVIVLSDHGRYVGAHGFEAHNFGAFEEIYRIPLIVGGPGFANGSECCAPVGIADLCPTICELAGAESIDVPDSRSFGDLLKSPGKPESEFESGYAEYHGTRFPLMQRVLWRDGWKFVFNGFDFDELYDLQNDPHEMTNLAQAAEHRSRVESMMSEVWRRVRDTGDRAIHESHYYSMRFACVGPLMAETD